VNREALVSRQGGGPVTNDGRPVSSARVMVQLVLVVLVLPALPILISW
jgi:hypothetical protein